MSKVYVYPRGKTPLPLNPEIEAETAQAIDENGQEIVTFYGENEAELKAQAQGYGWDEGSRLIWVDDPDDHPLIPGLVAGQLEREADADLEERASVSKWKPDELELIRNDSHICPTCDHVEVCGLVALPMFNAQKVVVAACLSFTPKRREDDAHSENEF